jgi:predicted dehydrogenase
MNAGFVAPDHWTQTEEGGGRIVGEACHILDLFQYLVDAPVAEVSATSIVPRQEHILADDNVSLTLRYEDGSVATLIYTSLGSPDFAKEYMELYVDGKVLVLDDFKSLQIYGASTKGWAASGQGQDKGHLEELRAFAMYTHGRHDMSISLDAFVRTTEASFVVLGYPDRQFATPSDTPNGLNE